MLQLGDQSLASLPVFCTRSLVHAPALYRRGFLACGLPGGASAMLASNLRLFSAPAWSASTIYANRIDSRFLLMHSAGDFGTGAHRRVSRRVAKPWLMGTCRPTFAPRLRSSPGTSLIRSPVFFSLKNSNRKASADAALVQPVLVPQHSCLRVLVPFRLADTRALIGTSRIAGTRQAEENGSLQFHRAGLPKMARAPYPIHMKRNYSLGARGTGQCPNRCWN